MSYDFDFTLETFKKAVPHCKEPEAWFEQFYEILPTYDITTMERVVAFLAQCGHESNSFNVLQENLNYSAEGLTKIFHKYFPTLESAQPYARKPEMIANRVYANRMGNGPEESGDGWRYRGRGIVQITGKDNYTRASMDLLEDSTLLENPDFLLDKYYAVHTACWFWAVNNLNTLADAQDMTAMTKRINGGTIGLDDRIAHYNHIVDVFNGEA